MKTPLWVFLPVKRFISSCVRGSVFSVFKSICISQSLTLFLGNEVMFALDWVKLWVNMPVVMNIIMQSQWVQ